MEIDTVNIKQIKLRNIFTNGQRKFILEIVATSMLYELNASKNRNNHNYQYNVLNLMLNFLSIKRSFSQFPLIGF